MMQVAKKVPFEDPNVLNAVRGLYLLSNLIILAIYGYMKLQIDKKKGTEPLPDATNHHIHSATMADMLSLLQI